MEVKYGVNGVEFPPVEANRLAAQAYERAGLDFIVYWDQTCLSIPRSIWTPDLVPAANLYNIDDWLEPWPLMTDAALATERIRIGLSAADVVRRPPSLLAQLGLTLDHYAKGRFFLALGAGEIKECAPYGIARERPFARLEETLKIVRMFWENREPISYDGPIWKLANAVIGADTYTRGGPELLVAGGPGKAQRFAATLADGWVSYAPPTGSPETYAEEVNSFGEYARQVGRDPADMTRLMLFAVVLGDDEDQVEQLTHNAALRWDSAALVPGPSAWQRFGRVNPLGENYSYPRDLIPMDWSREDALRIVEQVPPEMVRNMKFCGTPEQVARQVQPYVEAGCNHVMLGDYGSLVNSGDMGQAVEGTRRLTETFDHLRRMNGQRPLALAAAGEAAR
ncbi:MAG TPA: LLM class flavin-dependent oxidoreductase [Pseudonocardia sp.]